MSQLFEPLRVGALVLPNRVVMAPLGRARAHADSREPLPSVRTYYTQRASAGLIISEATHVSAHSVSRPGTSAIHSECQVQAWRIVTDAVHEVGGRIFQQLFHLGRKADPARLPLGGLPPTPSAIPARGEFNTSEGPRPFPVPRALDAAEIPGIVREFAVAAENSLRAGFDGVEIHGANEQRADLIAFGIGYIANPDLVERLRLDAPWNEPDPSTYYSGGDKGYIDYPFLSR